MGCTPSCGLRRRSKPAFNSIRIVHLNGFVQDFTAPTTVSQITGKPPKQFLCSSNQLLSFGSQPLALDARLQLGHLYFLLPLSVFQSNASPTDLVSLVTRLTAAAGHKSSLVSSPSRFFSSSQGLLASSPSPSRFFSSSRDSPASSPARSRFFSSNQDSPASSPSHNRFFSSSRDSLLSGNLPASSAYKLQRDNEALDPRPSQALYIEHLASRVSSWKPILETIEEKSFRRPSMRLEAV